MTRKTLKKKHPWAFKAEKALKKAVGNAIREHRKNGDDVAIWRDGKTVIVPATEVRVPYVRD